MAVVQASAGSSQHDCCTPTVVVHTQHRVHPKMTRQTLQTPTALLTAIVLLMQSVVALPAACGCVSKEGAATKSCCDTDEASSCCGQADSCCQSGDCAVGESNPRCQCGCGKHSEKAPFIPAEKSERTQSDIEISIALPSVATWTSVTSPKLSGVIGLTPYVPSGPHSMQARLCVWRT